MSAIPKKDQQMETDQERWPRPYTLAPRPAGPVDVREFYRKFSAKYANILNYLARN